jgi:ribonuclease E
MEKKMLINAYDSEECRIALVEDGILTDLEVESNIGQKLKGNIYKAKIARIEPSLQAAFIDIGANRNGFLQINDVHPSYFRAGYNPPSHHSRINIQDVLEPGQELILQVVKEEREQKGATLTTYLSLPGRYVVLMPGSDRGGVSRKIGDSEQRKRLKKLALELEIPAGIGMIVRTAGLDRSMSELSRDITLQIKLWERILEESQTAGTPQLLYKEGDPATRVIRDYFSPDVREILVDNKDTYHKVKDFIDETMPRYRSRVKFYDEQTPLFIRHGIEDQLIESLNREVKLPSGGALVIDSLEALVAIDVNSGKSTGGGSIEDTAYRTNLEAADEIARQIRLRDLGGLIVIDFIDMLNPRHKSEVEKRLQDAVSTDKARIEVGKISKFGLLEMSRQRLKASLASSSTIKCVHCQGTGQVKNSDVVAREVLRKIQSAVMVGQVAIVKARLSPGPAMILLNNKKQDLSKLENDYSTKIYVLADGRLRADEYELDMETLREQAEKERVAFASEPEIHDPHDDLDREENSSD